MAKAKRTTRKLETGKAAPPAAGKGAAVPRVTLALVIGCGGTGSILAEHLARLIVGHRLATALAVCDGDTVEAKNVTRQNFLPWEVGTNKAVALAARLSGQFAMEVFAVDRMFDGKHASDIVGDGTLTCSCVDTLSARKLVARAEPGLWLDCGNELAHGQAVIGTTHDATRLGAAWREFDKQPYATDLPDIAAVNPAVMRGRKVKPSASCADQPFAKQGFGVNAAAALAAGVLAKQALVDGVLTAGAIYFDVTAGRMLARPITRDLYEPWRAAK